VLACACAIGLLGAAPALGQEKLTVDLGVVGVDVDVSPGGANVNAGVAGTQLDVDVRTPNLPETPAPSTPSPPSIPDPGDTVDNVVDQVPGAGRQDPSTAPAPANTGSGNASNGGGGGSSSDPSASGLRQNGGSGDRGDGRSGDRSERGDRGGRDGGAGGRGDDRDGRRGERGSDRARDGGAAGGGLVADGSNDGVGADPASASTDEDEGGSGVTRTLERVVEVVPLPIKIALILLTLLAAGFFGRSHMHARRAGRLSAQREELLQDVGLLQQALLPEIPEKLGELATSVAYRPADGPAAGGDFYDAFLLDEERVAFIVGDVSGHGRSALARTALMRYTLRAYLDAGLEPRRALKVAGKALDDDLGGDFATVVLAIHDPARATLTYASAGHPPPLVTGSGAFDPVTALSSPPIGAGLPTGQRQTTLHMPSDAIACFFTDGLVEAKHGGDLVGRDKLASMLEDLGPHATAHGVIDAVAFYADETPDDMATCVIRPDEAGAVDHVPDRVEEVELTALDLQGDRVARFLAACQVPADESADALASVEASVGEFGAALLRVRIDKVGTRIEVESAAGLHDPLGAPTITVDAPVRVDQPITAPTSDAA